MKEIKQKKNIIWGITGLIAAVIILCLLYFLFREKPVAGSKDITISVTGKTTETVVYDLKTDAEFLRQAMEEAEGLTFSGSEGDYGLMVDTVNGETADYNVDASYWAFYVNDEYCNYGIDSQPVNDGDRFGIVYTVYTSE